MLPWAKSGLEENKSRKVLQAHLTETDKYYHRPSLAVFHFCEPVQTCEDYQETQTPVCVNRKPMAPAEFGCLVKQRRL